LASNAYRMSTTKSRWSHHNVLQ